MHPVSLIARAIRDTEGCPDLIHDTMDGICAVTGEDGPCVQRKHLLGKSFTDTSLLSAPESPHVSTDAYIALKYKWERSGSWVCNGKTFERLNRQGVRARVFAPPKVTFVAYATTSYKKHGALRAVVNTGGRNIWLFETRLADCTDKDRVGRWWGRLNGMLRAGVGRSVLESLNCPAWLLKRIGPAMWIDFEKWARPRSRSALYAFLCYLLPSQKELADEKKQAEQTVE